MSSQNHQTVNKLIVNIKETDNTPLKIKKVNAIITGLKENPMENNEKYNVLNLLSIGEEDDGW